jgi:DNA invertase Pin-like site-specific DNA recombinase
LTATLSVPWNTNAFIYINAAMFDELSWLELHEFSNVGRVRAGLRRARAEGTETGNPFGRPKIGAATEAAIRKALAKDDKGIRRIAAEFGVGTGTVPRIKAAA